MLFFCSLSTMWFLTCLNFDSPLLYWAVVWFRMYNFKISFFKLVAGFDWNVLCSNKLDDWVLIKRHSIFLVREMLFDFVNFSVKYFTEWWDLMCPVEVYIYDSKLIWIWTCTPIVQTNSVVCGCHGYRRTDVLLDFKYARIFSRLLWKTKEIFFSSFLFFKVIYTHHLENTMSMSTEHWIHLKRTQKSQVPLKLIAPLNKKKI